MTVCVLNLITILGQITTISYFGIKIKKGLYFRSAIIYVDRNEFPTNREKKEIPKT